MERALGGILVGVFASLAAVALAFGAATPQAEGASAVKVCGSGYGHGVGLSQYGAKGRAEAGQGHARIIKSYYSGVNLKESKSPIVRVLLAERPKGAKQYVGVKKGRKGQLKNLSSGGTKQLNPGRYEVRYLSGNKVYKVTNVTRDESVGVFKGPLDFRPAGGGPLLTRGNEYRGALKVQLSNSKLIMVNRLGMETYLRGVVPKEMPSSWEPAALQSQSIAARSYAEATRRSGPFDFFDDTRSQVYGGASAETAATNRAVSATARKLAVYDGEPITAFFHSASAGRTESAANVFGNATPYLKSVRDMDGNGRPYEGGAYADSPWMKWEGEIAPNGSPGFGVGSIEGVNVLDRAPSGRVEKIRVKGSDGEKTVAGQQDIRFGLKGQNITNRSGEFPNGPLPSARAKFGGDCN